MVCGLLLVTNPGRRVWCHLSPFSFDMISLQALILSCYDSPSFSDFRPDVFSHLFTNIFIIVTMIFFSLFCGINNFKIVEVIFDGV